MTSIPNCKANANVGNKSSFLLNQSQSVKVMTDISLFIGDKL